TGAMHGTDPTLMKETIDKYTAHFVEVFEATDNRIKELFLEPTAKDEDPQNFVMTKLKLQCFEIFQAFDKEAQEGLMSAIDELVMADGSAHPAELKFRAELAELLSGEHEIELVEENPEVARVSIAEPRRTKATGATHPFFDPTELPYSEDPAVIERQVQADIELIRKARTILAEQQEAGEGKLAGKRSMAELDDGPTFLDGHVYVVPRNEKKRYELLVLGDLHGCYSVLKAAVMQSQFFAKVDAWRADPEKHPEPKLVLLGDYIDRGLFSLNGVLRAVLQLFVTAPDHVYVLRGNHEYFVEFKGNVYGGVKPAEGIDAVKPYVSVDVLREYIAFFEAMPNMLLFDRTLFVHGGAPRDRTLKERWKDLSSLNDPDLRFQMMWSDPSKADVVPSDLQDKSARFSFGKLQARSFLQRLGVTTMVRGHEKVNSGFVESIGDEQVKVFTLFSSGGATNEDLPADSSYRSVTPMALTVTTDENGMQIHPWAPDYATYNAPDKNGFFR
ncbi:MAG TPA: metallophosphoesterase family protein, partial [Polyangiaceae bacterium]